MDPKTRIRPAPGGCSIGHFAITAGTFGMVVKKKGIRYILSNNHVLANMNDASLGDQILQPGAYDGGTANDIIAHLSEFVPVAFISPSDCPLAQIVTKAYNFLAEVFKRKTRIPRALSFLLNKVDCALARPIDDNNVSDAILEIGKPAGFGEAQVNDQVKKSGRTSGLTHGIVTITDATVTVSYGTKQAIFEDQVAADIKGEPGDSGSIILTEDNKVVGLLFAGSDTVTLINKISNVIAALELEETK
jgi:hypothetical protein